VSHRDGSSSSEARHVLRIAILFKLNISSKRCTLELQFVLHRCLSFFSRLPNLLTRSETFQNGSFTFLIQSFMWQWFSCTSVTIHPSAAWLVEDNSQPCVMCSDITLGLSEGLLKHQSSTGILTLWFQSKENSYYYLLGAFCTHTLLIIFSTFVFLIVIPTVSQRKKEILSFKFFVSYAPVKIENCCWQENIVLMFCLLIACSFVKEPIPCHYCRKKWSVIVSICSRIWYWFLSCPQNARHSNYSKLQQWGLPTAISELINVACTVKELVLTLLWFLCVTWFM
jgi:hypothetical protein